MHAIILLLINLMQVWVVITDSLINLQPAAHKNVSPGKLTTSKNHSYSRKNSSGLESHANS